MTEEPQDRDGERSGIERDGRVDRFVDPLERGLAGCDRQRAGDHVEGGLRRAAGVIGEGRRPVGGTDREVRRLDRLLRVQRAGEPAERRIGVDVAHGDLQRRLERPDARAEPRHQERMRAVFDEHVGVDRHRLEAEHVLKRLAKRLLRLRLRPDDRVGEPEARGLGLRQELAVGLVADQRRDERQALEIGRRHIGRQPRPHVRDDRARVGRNGAVLDRVIGDEFLRAGLRLEGRSDRLGDFRNVEQNRFDLGQLDPVAAQLDLRVDAAEILDLAVIGQATEVAGAIDAARRVVGQREEVPDELLLGQLRPVEVALGDADAGDPDLARLPGRDRNILLGVENDDRIGRQRLADRDRLLGRKNAERRGDGRLGRTIAVEQSAAGTAPALDQRRRARFAANKKDAQLRQLAIDRGEQRRHAGEAGDRTGFEEIGKLLAEQARGLRVGDERRPGDQRDPHFLDREVEGDRHALVDAVAGAEAIGFGGDADEIADARVGDRHALGLAGRARGVEHVAETLAALRLFRFGSRRIVEAGDLCARGVENKGLDPRLRELVGEAQMRDAERSASVLEDVAQAIDRVVRVERDVGRAGFQEPEQRHIGVDAAVEQHADPVARLDAAGAKEPRHLAGARAKLPVAELGAVGGDGDSVGESAARLVQHVVETLAKPPAQRRGVAQDRSRTRRLKAAQIGQRIRLEA